MAESCNRQLDLDTPRNFWSYIKVNISLIYVRKFYFKQNILLIKGQKVIVVRFKSYLGE